MTRDEAKALLGELVDEWDEVVAAADKERARSGSGKSVWQAFRSRQARREDLCRLLQERQRVVVGAEARARAAYQGPEWLREGATGTAREKALNEAVATWPARDRALWQVWLAVSSYAAP